MSQGSYEIQFLPSARKELERISSPHHDRILAAITALADDPRPVGCVKLAGQQAYRIRVGNYRVIYQIADAKLIIVIVKVGHRRDVYR